MKPRLPLIIIIAPFLNCVYFSYFIPAGSYLAILAPPPVRHRTAAVFVKFREITLNSNDFPSTEIMGGKNVLELPRTVTFLNIRKIVAII